MSESRSAQPETYNNTSDLRAIPEHVAIIMDGNGRFATKQGKARSYGHKMGAANLINICRHAKTAGIKYLTVYAFSTENWQRPATEIQALFKLVDFFFTKYLRELLEEGVKVKFIGLRTSLPDNLIKRIEEVEALTGSNDKFNLIIALNYGARQEIAHACLQIAKAAINDPASAQLTTTDMLHKLSANLWTTGIPDPDLLIRTAGELRLSNFLLWQCAYTELYVSDKLWPEFSETDLQLAITAYARRVRKFGALPSDDEQK